MADTAYLPVDDELAVLRRRVGQLERFLAEDAVNYDALSIAERRMLEFATLADRLKAALDWVEDVTGVGLTHLPGWWEIVVPALEEWDRLRGGEF